MTALYVSLLSSFIGALVGSVVTILGTNYFLYSANRPKYAERLTQAISLNLAKLEPLSGTEVHGQIDDISFDEFHDFLSTKWPWEKRKIKTVWKNYQLPNSRADKIKALRTLLQLVEK